MPELTLRVGRVKTTNCRTCKSYPGCVVCEKTYDVGNDTPYAINHALEHIIDSDDWVIDCGDTISIEKLAER